MTISSKFFGAFNNTGLGTFRVILAISVVIAHSALIFGHNVVDGVIAVQSFYIISGFLMALILTEKYHSYNLFITNRYARLYPTYLAVVILTVIVSLISFVLCGNWFQMLAWTQSFNLMNLSSVAILLFSNLTIFGLDILMFFGLDPNTGMLFFTPNFYSVAKPAYTFFMVPQAWTIGVELLFYLIAPFLIKLKTRYLIFLFTTSILLRILFYTVTGYGSDPWTYRFFPFELAFFLAGMLTYRAYVHFSINKIKLPETLIPVSIAYTIPTALISLLFLFAFGYDFINLPHKSLIFYGIVLITLPFLFMKNSSNPTDKKIGDYSYPIYIGHRLIIQILALITIPQIFGDTAFALISIVLSIAFAGLLVKFIERPLNKYRQNRVKKQEGSNAYPGHADPQPALDQQGIAPLGLKQN